MSLSVNIRKNLGKFRLDVAFDCGDEVLALLGASGCGKSMTLKCIAGIETPDEGRIVLNGRVLFDSQRRINLSPQQRRVGYLFQQYALFPNMTVWQNIAVGVRSRDKAVVREAVAAKLRALQLEGLEKKRPGQLSGGQQQRVALARILVNEPECLLLDEPFSALDSYLKWQLELELADTLAAFGGTAVFVSHSRDEVYRLCDSVCILTDGRSEPKETVRQLFDTPRTLSACLLSGCKNFSRIQPAGEGLVRAVDWDATLRIPGPLPEGITHIGVRAHYIDIVPAPGENVLLCRVDRVIDNVFSTVLMLDTGAGCGAYSLIRVEMPKERWAALGNPAEILIHIRPKDILLLRQ